MNANAHTCRPNEAPVRRVGVPYGRPLPRLDEQVLAIERLLKPLGRCGCVGDKVPK